MSDHHGLSGVVRVRSVRERDSRTGLAAALAEERAAAAEVADLQQMLISLPAPRVSDLASFQGHQHTIELIRTALGAAHQDLEVARQLTVAARDRWVADKSRLAAVESLVERRAAAARLERRRREDRELDEIAGELWRRNNSAQVAR
ncbi:flagellar FliJ family protein [Nocardioides sp. CN2-186]|uniref:flagellar FliJ family protein n=1 Tax=Nocardioides tweenelious TaxID=3156607 RepID=UPI0032B4C44C